MRILVTGGAGFIGSHLVRSLTAAGGHEVLNIDLLTHAGSKQTLADLESHPKHRLLQADIGDAEAMRQAFTDFQPEQIIHLAAESHVDRSIDAPQRFMETNVMGTFVLLQEARHYLEQNKDARASFRFLHVSTDEVYGSVSASDAFRESTAYDPHSPYSASKASADHLVRAWHHTYGMPILITHSSNNYGPFQSPDKLVPRVIQKALKGEAIPIYGDGSHVRDWLHVRDHVSALQQVLAKGQVGESYNIGAQHLLTNLELANQLCALLDELQPREDGSPYSQLITLVADRPGHDQRYAIDDTKIRSELDWSPQHEPKSGFHETVRWYLNHPDWTEHMLSRTN